ncbi:hypothetical protein BC938DRAFT_483797 [Jimgerdemannia flammicorona]|uniref:NADPH:adrenodoxin oxidoreductase, mitochondrial n=1 Tax=Jimgerdemannia flammicorona TaxID=994334 RepID=A0A433QB94_9FUNG|nr:hypothetical protein BC938DRAFT_483797 [Jimgerdemannia flammicorona]
MLIASRKILRLSTVSRCLSTTRKIEPAAAAFDSFRLAVIGSGPAGFYTAHKVLKEIPNAFIDMYEALPVPHGLVRFGVAPDHPEVKNVMNKFDEVAQDPRFNFIGNITIGRDFALTDLKPHYHAVLLSYGASEDRRLDIPGENARGVLSARAFVAWYNGLPLHRDLEPDLTKTDTAVVIGQDGYHGVCVGGIEKKQGAACTGGGEKGTTAGNSTFTNSQAPKAFMTSFDLCEAAFTAKELREMMALPDTAFSTDTALLQAELTAGSPFLDQNRPLKRLMSILDKGSATSLCTASKSWSLDFLRSPVEILTTLETDLKVEGVRFEINRLVGPVENSRAEGTGEFETVSCGIVLRSIGYRSVGLEDVPFDERAGRVPNKYGKIIAGGEELPGMYTSGWLKRGPTGVIATTMSDAYETAETIATDLRTGKRMLGDGAGPREGAGVILPLLQERGLRPVTYPDWKVIEQAEFEFGALLGKPREKFGRVEEMIRLLKEKQG